MICKGNPIIIGTQFNHTRYFLMNEREALREWRQANGMVRKRLKKVYVDKFDFGYVF